MSKYPDTKESVNETTSNVESLHAKFVTPEINAQTSENKPLKPIEVYPAHPLTVVSTKMSSNIGIFKEVEDAEINARVKGEHGISAAFHNLLVSLGDLKHSMYELEKNSNAEAQSIIKHIKSVLLKETS